MFKEQGVEYFKRKVAVESSIIEYNETGLFDEFESELLKQGYKITNGEK